jgi:putative ABC transport system permease protein
MGVGVSFVVGIVSGLYPAVRASKLDPIEAMRND